MATYPYAIAAGWSASVLTAVEDIVTFAPQADPVPLGSVRRTTLNQNVQTNGAKVIKWHFKAMSQADFAALVAFIWGNFDTENANVTIRTRKRDETFANYNCVAVLPTLGVDYQRRFHGDVQDLDITFRDLQ